MNNYYYATREELERLDREAVSAGMSVAWMMELAGWHILEVFRRLRIDRSKKVSVIVGKGNKGGDGICAARHLVNNGWKVNVILADKKVSRSAMTHLDLIKSMGLDVELYTSSREETEKMIGNSEVLIDALIGYNLKGPLRSPFDKLVSVINTSGVPIISYDIPTGVDSTSGEVYPLHVKAYATLIMMLPKMAFKNLSARAEAGRIFLADIGVPSFIYDKVAKGSRPVFSRDFILEI